MSKDFKVEPRALELIKGNDLVQKVLNNLHPNADTWLTSGINSDNVLQIGVGYGAYNRLLYADKDAERVLEIMNQLQELDVLGKVQDNRFGVRWALPTEWEIVIDDSPHRFHRNYQFREQLHQAIGSKLPKEYSIGD